MKKINSWLNTPITWGATIKATLAMTAIGLIYNFVVFVLLGWIDPWKMFKKETKTDTETEKPEE